MSFLSHFLDTESLSWSSNLQSEKVLDMIFYSHDVSLPQFVCWILLHIFVKKKIGNQQLSNLFVCCSFFSERSRKIICEQPEVKGFECCFSIGDFLCRWRVLFTLYSSASSLDKERVNFELGHDPSIPPPVWPASLNLRRQQSTKDGRVAQSCAQKRSQYAEKPIQEQLVVIHNSESSK
jgi:hypothetical protein